LGKAATIVAAAFFTRLLLKTHRKIKSEIKNCDWGTEKSASVLNPTGYAIYLFLNQRETIADFDSTGAGRHGAHANQQAICWPACRAR
jgi:hypothetical protein